MLGTVTPCATPAWAPGPSGGCASPPTGTRSGSRGRRLSHAGFAQRVRRAAAALADLGVGAGDRVAWFGGNHPSALETLYACGQLGAIWVPVNARLTAPEARVRARALRRVACVVHGRDHGAAGRRAARRRPDLDRRRAAGRGGAGLAALRGRCSPRADPAQRDEPGLPRRPVPDHVHLGHDRPAQGRGAHPRQHDLERGQPVRSAWTSTPTSARSRWPRCSTSAGSTARSTRPCCAAGARCSSAASTRPRRSRSSRSSGSPRSSPSRRCSTRWPREPGFAHPRPVGAAHHRRGRRAAAARRPCAPGSTAASPCSRPTA